MNDSLNEDIERKREIEIKKMEENKQMHEDMIKMQSKENQMI